MSDRKNHTLENIYFLELPDDLHRRVGDFAVDPERKLPVEFPPGSDPSDRSSLSWEMIVAGMLKMLAYVPDHDDSDYYRSFIHHIKPGIVEELTETGVLKARNGDFAIAEEIFLALRGLLPGNPLPILNLALLYEQASDAEPEESKRSAEMEERAFACYREVLAHDQTPAEASFNAGFFFLKRHNHERALELFRRFLSESEDDSAPSESDDDTARKRGEAQRIINEIEARNLTDRLFKEAFDFIKLGREEEAMERITRFLETNPDVWNGWFLLGWAQRRKEMYAEGRYSFEKALELGGRNPDTLNELAICLMEIGELAESLRRLHDALTLEPENTKVMSNMGVVHLKQGEPAEALAYFHAVLEYDPEDPVALHFLRELESEG